MGELTPKAKAQLLCDGIVRRVVDDLEGLDPFTSLGGAARAVEGAAIDADNADLDDDQEEAVELLMAAAAAAVRGIIQAGPDATSGSGR